MKPRLPSLSAVILAASIALAGPETGTVQFREPEVRAYQIDPQESSLQAGETEKTRWLAARPIPGTGRPVHLGSRVVLRLTAGTDRDLLLEASPLRVVREVAPALCVLEAVDAWTAASEADRLAQQPGVEVCHPVRRRPVAIHGDYAPRPDDPLYLEQWHLENRDPNTGASRGFDLNLRAAWPAGSGEGILVAMSDNGVELSHPDLAARVQHSHHFNFVTGSPTGNPTLNSQAHGTAVAGLIAATGNNRRGVVGIAPAIQLASWIVFDTADGLADEEAVMDMFQYRSNVVSVQNHSWGNASIEQLPLSALEDQGVRNAVEDGRGGRGVVLVRSAGNDRQNLNDVNDDAYGNDPRAIAVGAVRNTGRVASYSTPGAPVLVAAFSGDKNVATAEGTTVSYPGVATTDRQGSLGFNTRSTASGGDYGYGSSGFDGTSASAPQVSGLCALLLEANPALTWRDVQQVLVLAARQLDPADPDIRTNGAGYAVSHNVGFGVPDPAHGIALAHRWRLRPPAVTVTSTNAEAADIPDDGLRLRLTGTNVPPGLASIPATPFDGPHPDDPTEALPLVDVGLALTPITIDLRGCAALIRRGSNYFAQKLAYAAAAGARFAVVYNNTGGTERLFMNGADIHFTPIPAVFISQNSGEALRVHLAAGGDTRAQLALDTARFPLPIDETLLCEHVRLQVRFSHPRRADVRLTLVSPMGTRSVLHHYNNDVGSALGEWTFTSIHHVHECSAGVWYAEVSDERPQIAGRVLSMVLSVDGVRITDTDRDALDDDWERENLGTLAGGPCEDPDQDGAHNSREMILGTNPLLNETPFRIDVTPWNNRIVRLTWPAVTGVDYTVTRQPDLAQPPQPAQLVPGRYPECESLMPAADTGLEFFRVRQP
ncbi:MAG TPA: S8 family serine peptidase [Verrucomicrobiota bacterium]|nr:S8 family serine peptidase [Verrucomicrobiota bacterium]HNU53309.1 S8 family serine peptidase [Verrucomicrobiota bacterium]